MSLRDRIAATTVGASAFLAATPSWALCPNCLGQSPTLSPALRIVGLFLLVPPAIFFAVAIAIRKLSQHPPS
jgi:hypothetical protein